MGQGRDLGGTLPERTDDGDAFGRLDRGGREGQAERDLVAGCGIADSDRERAHAAHSFVAGFGETLVANARQALSLIHI